METLITNPFFNHTNLKLIKRNHLQRKDQTMKSRTLLFIATISTLIFTGCQNNDLSAENQSLKQQISEMEQQIADLEQQVSDLEEQNNTANLSEENTTSVSNNSSATNMTPDSPTYTMEELSEMVDEFTVSVGSATPDINNSGNLDQFFSLKREADQIDQALENHENSLEDQSRSGTISREEYRKLDKEIEKLEELLDSAKDRLEITFDIDD